MIHFGLNYWQAFIYAKLEFLISRDDITFVFFLKKTNPHHFKLATSLLEQKKAPNTVSHELLKLCAVAGSQIGKFKNLKNTIRNQCFLLLSLWE